MELWKAADEALKDYYEMFGRFDMESGKAADIFPKIIARAGKDVKFRVKLLNAPVKVLAREGFKLPKGFNLKFVEASENTILIPLLPFVGKRYPRNDKTKLTELNEIIHIASEDFNFRKELMAKPDSVLAKRGFEIDPDKKIVVLECTDDLFYAILPRTETQSIIESHVIELEITDNTVHLSGRLDADGVERIREVLLSWEGDLILDMKNLNYISSAGLSLLLMILKKQSEASYQMKLIKLKPTVRNVFVLAGFDQIFHL